MLRGLTLWCPPDGHVVMSRPRKDGDDNELTIFVPTVTLYRHCLPVGSYVTLTLAPIRDLVPEEEEEEEDVHTVVGSPGAANPTILSLYVRLEVLPTAALGTLLGSSAVVGAVASPLLVAHLANETQMSQLWSMDLDLSSIRSNDEIPSASCLVLAAITEHHATASVSATQQGGVSGAARSWPTAFPPEFPFSSTIAHSIPILLQGRVVESGRFVSVDWLNDRHCFQVVDVQVAGSSSSHRLANGHNAPGVYKVTASTKISFLSQHNTVLLPTSHSSDQPRAPVDEDGPARGGGFASERHWVEATCRSVYGYDALVTRLVRTLRAPLVRRLWMLPVEGTDDAATDANRCQVAAVAAAADFSQHILLHGSPGTGKSSLAVALARASNLPFLVVKAADLFEKRQGHSERQLHKVWEYAAAKALAAGAEAYAQAVRDQSGNDGGVTQAITRACACVIVLDDLDALSPNQRHKGAFGSSLAGTASLEMRMVDELARLLDLGRPPSTTSLESASSSSLLSSVSLSSFSSSRSPFSSSGSSPFSFRLRLQPLLLVVGTSNRLAAVHPSLRRGGRFDTVIELPALSAKARETVFAKMLQRMNRGGAEGLPGSNTNTNTNTSTNTNTTSKTTCENNAHTDAKFIREFSARCGGYTGADIEGVVREATMSAIKKMAAKATTTRTRTRTGDADADASVKEQQQQVCLTPSDFYAAQGSVRPILGRYQYEGPSGGSPATSSPSAASMSSSSDEAKDTETEHDASASVAASLLPSAYAHLGGLHGQIRQLQLHVALSFRKPWLWHALSVRLGVRPSAGALIYGPPGTGKTALALSFAQDMDVPILNVNASSLLSKVVGETEKAIKTLFASARATAPCIVLLDQIETIVPCRGGTGGLRAKGGGSRRRHGQGGAHGGKAAGADANPDADADGDGDTDGDEDDCGDVATDLTDQGDHAYSQVEDRVLSALLMEIDGVVHKIAHPLASETATASSFSSSSSSPSSTSSSLSVSDPASAAASKAVIIIATTNAPHLVDAAMTRHGRLQTHVYIPPPDEQARKEILLKQMAPMPICFRANNEDGNTITAPPHPDPVPAPVFITVPTTDRDPAAVRTRDALAGHLASRTVGFSGADLANLCKEAALLTLRTDPDAAIVAASAFDRVLETTRPSLLHAPVRHPRV